RSPGDRGRGKSEGNRGKSGSDPVSALRGKSGSDPVSGPRFRSSEKRAGPHTRSGRTGKRGNGGRPISALRCRKEDGKDPISLRREPRTRTCRSACVVRATGRDGNALAALIRS